MYVTRVARKRYASPFAPAARSGRTAAGIPAMGRVPQVANEELKGKTGETDQKVAVTSGRVVIGFLALIAAMIIVLLVIRIVVL